MDNATSLFSAPHRHPEFDINAFASVARTFEGMHDFRTFMAVAKGNPRQQEAMHSLRRIDQITVERGHTMTAAFNRERTEHYYDFWDVRIRGRSFLYRQVSTNLLSHETMLPHTDECCTDGIRLAPMYKEAPKSNKKGFCNNVNALVASFPGAAHGWCLGGCSGRANYRAGHLSHANRAVAELLVQQRICSARVRTLPLPRRVRPD